jgi:adenylate kinase family enzyme
MPAAENERQRYTISDDTVTAIAQAVHETEKSGKSGRSALLYLASLLRGSRNRTCDTVITDGGAVLHSQSLHTDKTQIPSELTTQLRDPETHISNRSVSPPASVPLAGPQQDEVHDSKLNAESIDSSIENVAEKQPSELEHTTNAIATSETPGLPEEIQAAECETCIVAPQAPSEQDSSNAQLAESAPTIPNNLIVLIIGGPGSGKGTVCSRLVSDFGFAHLSVGELLREEVAAQSPLGIEAESIMAAGQLVPDELVLNIVQSQLSNFNRSVLLDGFPRTLRQAQLFTVSPSLVLWLNCEEDILVDRILERAKHSGREDDNIETVTQRIKTFKANADQIVDFYKEKDHFVTIDGSRTIDEVYAEVEESINLVL